MAKIVKGVRKKDKKEGLRLQKLANAMLGKGGIDSDYLQLRRSAERHMGMWDWQKSTPKWLLPRSNDTRPYKCTHIFIGGEQVSCPNLPAGSRSCREGECPTEL
jgi:hypothetical protein